MHDLVNGAERKGRLFHEVYDIMHSFVPQTSATPYLSHMYPLIAEIDAFEVFCCLVALIS